MMVLSSRRRHGRLATALAVVALLLCALPGAALAKTSPPPPPAYAEAAADLDAFFTTLPGLGMSGTFLVAVGDDVILHRAYGWADGAQTDPLQRSDIHVAASISKVFTATALMDLQERGKLDIDDPIAAHLDGVPADKQAITIRQLITHTSGLQPDGALPWQFESLPRDEAVQLALTGDLLFAPGTGFSYANAGFVLAGAIVEEVSGRSFERYVRKHILKRLHLKRTGFYGERLDRPGDYARVAVSPHDLFPDEIAPFGSPDDTNPRYWPFTWALKGAGGMVSTPADLLSFFEEICQPGRVLDTASVQEMLARNPVGGYGLGLQYLSNATYGPMVFHSGGNDFGNKAMMLRYLDHDVTFIWMSNTFDDDNSPSSGSLIFTHVPGILAANGLMAGGGAAGRCVS